jgi:preprotein translocase subunit SecE
LTAKLQKPTGKKEVKKKEKPSSQPRKKANRLARFWRSTIGELRKVSWPTPPEAWRLTKVVLVVVFVMAALLGLLDFVFSRIISVLVSL